MTTLHILAETCFACWKDNTLPLISLNATFDITLTEGRYFDRVYQSSIGGSFLNINSVVGTLNNQPIDSAEGWFYPFNWPGDLTLTVDSQDYLIFYNHHEFMFVGERMVPLTWQNQIVETPAFASFAQPISEPSTFWLMLIPLIFLLLIRRRLS